MSLNYDFDYASDEPTYQQMVDQTILAIADGQLLEDEVLPSSRKTMANIGLSPTTINRATTKLRVGGFIRVKPGIGAFVNVRQDPEMGIVQSRDGMRLLLAKCFLKGVPKEKVHEMVDKIWDGFRYDKNNIYEG